MRQFNQLSETEQKSAVDHCIEDIFSFMVEEDTVPQFLEEFLDIIKAAMAEAERLLTPWFFLDILQVEIGKNPKMKDCILAEAVNVAKQSWYPDPDEMIIRLPEDEDEKDLNLN
jgi:hypothetical protein